MPLGVSGGNQLRVMKLLSQSSTVRCDGMVGTAVDKCKMSHCITTCQV